MLALAFSSAAYGCADDRVGGQTGDEDALPRITIPGSSADNSCSDEDSTVVLTSLDDDRAGFTPREVLDFAVGSFSPMLTWHPDSPREWEMERQITPANGSSETLELDIEHAGGEIAFVGPATQFCGRLDIDVQVTLETQSGALDEQIAGVLRAYSASEAWLELQLHSRAFEIEVPAAIDGPQPPPPAPLSGSLSVSMTIMYQPDDVAEEDVDDPATYTLADTGELAAVIATLLFSPAGLEGHIDAWIYGRESGVLTLAEDIATFGDSSQQTGRAPGR